MTDRIELMFDSLSETPVVTPSRQAVKQRGRQRRHRAVSGHIGVVVAAAAAVAAVAVAPPAVLGSFHRSGGTTPGAPGTPAAFLTAGPSTAPSFPFTPSYLPAGLKSSPRLSYTPGDNHFAAWDSTRPRRDRWDSGISVSVSEKLITDTLPEDKGVPVTVQGHPGLYRAQAGQVSWWQRPGVWISVVGASDGTHDFANRAELMKVAEGLREKPMTSPALFGLALAPVNFRVVAFSDGPPFGPEITLGAGGGTPHPEQSAGPPGFCMICAQLGEPAAITIRAHRTSSKTDGHGQPVTIGPRSGWLVKDQGRYDLTVKVSDAIRLEIVTAARSPWTTQELLRFAAGVTYAGPTPYGDS